MSYLPPEAQEGERYGTNFDVGTQIMRQLTSAACMVPNLHQVQLRLEAALIKPIDLIAEIVNEECPEEQWDTNIDLIKFQALRELAGIIAKRKRAGENSQNLKQLCDSINDLQELLKESQKELELVQQELSNTMRRHALLWRISTSGRIR